MQPLSPTQRTVSTSQKRKWEEEINTDKPRRTQGRWRVDRALMVVSRSCPTLQKWQTEKPKRGKESPEWKKCECTVKEELSQLLKKGTWKLTEKPAEAIPITNKWVFTKKYNKDGNLLKYKAQLVVKGCTQRPGYDYNETFSPIIRLETIRAILVLSVTKNLVVH